MLRWLSLPSVVSGSPGASPSDLCEGSAALSRLARGRPAPGRCRFLILRYFRFHRPRRRRAPTRPARRGTAGINPRPPRLNRRRGGHAVGPPAARYRGRPAAPPLRGDRVARRLLPPLVQIPAQCVMPRVNEKQQLICSFPLQNDNNKADMPPPMGCEPPPDTDQSELLPGAAASAEWTLRGLGGVSDRDGSPKGRAGGVPATPAPRHNALIPPIIARRVRESSHLISRLAT